MSPPVHSDRLMCPWAGPSVKHAPLEEQGEGQSLKVVWGCVSRAARLRWDKITGTRRERAHVAELCLKVHSRVQVTLGLCITSPGHRLRAAIPVCRSRRLEE